MQQESFLIFLLALYQLLAKVMRMQKFRIFFQNWKGEWVDDSATFFVDTTVGGDKAARTLHLAKKRLEKIRKRKALNGRATLQQIS